MARKEQPLFEIDLGANGGRVTFASLEDVEKWIAAEQAFWSWVAQLANQDGNLSQVWGAIASPFGNARRLIQECRSQVGQASFPNCVANLKSSLEGSYSGGIPPHSKTPKARMVEALRKSGDLAAGYALAYFCGVTVSNLRAQAFTGAIDAVLFEKGLLRANDAEKQALEALRREWSDHLIEYRKLQNDLHNQFSLTSERMDKLLSDSENEIKALLTRQTAQFDQQLTDSKEALTSIGNTYDQKLALQAPVKYWQQKRQTHLRLVIGLSILTIVFFVAGGYGFYQYLQELLIAIKPGIQLEYWRISAIVLGATIFLWIARILVRLLMSQIHLESDASERVTMVQTYLSLMRKGVGPKESDLQFVLQALFRQSSDGIVRDDGVPPNAFEQLTRANKQ